MSCQLTEKFAERLKWKLVSGCWNLVAGISLLIMFLSADALVAFLVAVSFAAGLNVYATVATLGLLARANVLTLPGNLDLLGQWWVIGGSGALFLIEFAADKIPGFDLIWNALQTFVRV